MSILPVQIHAVIFSLPIKGKGYSCYILFCIQTALIMVPTYRMSTTLLMHGHHQYEDVHTIVGCHQQYVESVSKHCSQHCSEQGLSTVQRSTRSILP